MFQSRKVHRTGLVQVCELLPNEPKRSLKTERELAVVEVVRGRRTVPDWKPGPAASVGGTTGGCAPSRVRLTLTCDVSRAGLIIAIHHTPQ